MKFKSLLLLALAAILTVAAPRPARAVEVSFDFFYDALSPYGEWIQVGDYGDCWRPTGVDEDWTPYSDGYWAYTDAGWTWVSYEEFGGIVYHYGRWVKVEDEGWVWVPDYEWGPAWVSWRKNDDYVGWAPLPAEAHWRRDRGFSVWVDSSYDIGPSEYNFCHVGDFGAPVLRPVIIQRSENFVIVNNTVNITNISYNSGSSVVFNGGLEYAFINRFARRPVPALKLVRNNNVTVVNNTIVNNFNNVRVTNFNAVQRGNQLTVLAPTVVRTAAGAHVQPKIARVIPQEKVTRGWGSVPAAQREAIKAKYAQETKGLTAENAPARAVQPAELKIVPVKANPLAKIPVPVRPGAPLTPVTGKPPVAGRIPPASENPVTSLPATPKPIASDSPTPKPTGVVKPFTPAGDGPAAAPNDAAAKRQAIAAEAAAKRQAAVEAAVARKQALTEDAAAKRAAAAEKAAAANEQRSQQESERKAAAAAAIQQKQELIHERLKPADQAPAESATAAAAKRELQQQQAQEAIARRAAAQQQAQEAASARAAQAADARQRALQAREAQSAAAAARQQQMQENRPPAGQPRNLPPANVAPPKKQAPVRDKRTLTPEEAAKLQNQQ